MTKKTVTKMYPTLWSSDIAKGDFLLLRQGYAIPLRETEWENRNSMAQQGLAILMMGGTSQANADLFDQLWEEHREVNLYFMNKYMEEFLGVAITNAKHGQPVQVDCA